MQDEKTEDITIAVDDVPEEPKKKKKKRFLVIFIIALLGVCGLGVYYFFGDDWYDTNALSGSYEGKSEEEIIADLNRIVEEGYMNISIASTIIFEDGSSEGEARIDNIEANTRDQIVTITLADTGEVIYESGAIAPGQYIQKIKLNRDLEAGSHKATATFTGYDQETHEKRGAAALDIVLLVQS